MKGKSFLADKSLVIIIKTMNIGGAEKFTYHLCSHFKEYFKQIYLISSGGYFVKSMEDPRIQHIRIPFYLFNKIFFPLLFFRLRFILDKLNFDLVHCQHRLPQLALQLMKLKVPLIYTANNSFNDIYQKLLRPDIAAGVSPLITINLRQTTFLPPENIININYGVKLNQQSLVGEKRKTFRLLFAGRVIRVKGIYDIIAAFNLIYENCHVSLRVCGEGKDLKRVKKIVGNSSYSHLVEFISGTLDEDVIYKNADLLIIPTRLNEGLPVSILEAAARGIPSLASAAGGITDFIDDGMNGFLVNNLSPESIAVKIKSIIDIPEDEYDNIRLNALNSAASDFKIEKMLEKYLDLYTRLTLRK